MRLSSSTYATIRISKYDYSHKPMRVVAYADAISRIIKCKYRHIKIKCKYRHIKKVYTFNIKRRIP